jgi:hypothetical protein
MELDLYKKSSTSSNATEQHEITTHLFNTHDIITCRSSATFLSPEALGSKFHASPSNVSNGVMSAASLSTIIDSDDDKHEKKTSEGKSDDKGLSTSKL